MEKEAFEPTGLIPRSIIRTVDRFVQQLLPGREKIALQEYRVSRYQILVSIKSLLTLILIPLLVNFTIKALLFTPLIEYFWNSRQAEIFLNQYQEKRAFSEMHEFSEKMFFESLLVDNRIRPMVLPATNNVSISLQVPRSCFAKHNLLHLGTIPARVHAKPLQCESSCHGQSSFVQVPTLASAKHGFAKDFAPIPCFASQIEDLHRMCKSSVQIFDLQSKTQNVQIFCANLRFAKQSTNGFSLPVLPSAKLKTRSLENDKLPGFCHPFAEQSNGATEKNRDEQELFFRDLALRSKVKGQGESQNKVEGLQDVSNLIDSDNDKYQKLFQKKSLELAKRYNKQSIVAITNLLGDFLTFFTLSFLFRLMRPELIILKSFLTESVYSLSDTTKSFLLILGMDLLVGFHSPRGWELVLELFLRHVGLPENENFILLFVALFPVFLDTVFKYWIFRYLNKISPSTVVTYHSMIE